ncbi:MAG TPA: glycosyltransferase [Candidatus Omnitrophota bacterium]|nr:glycosyltransferase [Candidatus Omnitrophota bacterium]
MKLPFVSIIIPAYNCEKTIAQAVEGCLRQTCKGFEVIVVDDGSTDKTYEVIAKYPQISYLRQENAGPASARNAGARLAKGDIIFFTDSDCIPHADWLDKVVIHFEKGDVGAVAGSYGIANPENILARCIHQEIIFRHHRLMPAYPKILGSYNCAVRKNVFENVGGFNARYRQASGEDNDLSYKILKAGHKIYFEPQALVDHHHTSEVFKYLKEQFRHGFWRVKMYQDHPHMLSGDDYTFWKDMLEVFLVCLFVLTGIGSFYWPFLGPVALGAVLFLFILECVYAVFMQKNFFEVIFFSFVMFFRSFSRALGFSSGIGRLISRFILKKS